MRSLIRSVVLDARYRAGQTDAAGAVPTKMLSPDQLASAIEDLTGYRWIYNDHDMLRSDTVGVRTLAGGADGVTVTRQASPRAVAELGSVALVCAPERTPFCSH